MYMHNFLRRIDWWSQIWRNFSRFGLRGCRTLVGLWNFGGKIHKNISLSSFLHEHCKSEVRNSIAHRNHHKNLLQRSMKTLCFWRKIVNSWLKSIKKHGKRGKNWHFLIRSLIWHLDTSFRAFLWVFSSKCLLLTA